VLSAAQNQAGRARPIAVAAPHSGDFLNAIPCSSVETRLDETSLRYAISLRLGATICAPHTCICGMQDDSSGVHGLACRKSAGRHLRHNAVNDLVKRALASVNVSSVLEPNSLFRDDGNRPDGLTVLPWANDLGFHMSRHFGNQSLEHLVLFAGAAANEAERRKVVKYRIAHCRFYTASCQWRSSHLVRWAWRRPTSSATSDTGSRL